MGEDILTIRVECYAGYRAEQTPQRFYIGERKIEVSEVIDSWLSPEQKYFKVRGDDEGIYILCYDVNKDTWQLRLFDSGKGPLDRLSST